MKKIIAALALLAMVVILVALLVKPRPASTGFSIGPSLPAGKVVPQLMSGWEGALLLAPDGSLWGWGRESATRGKSGATQKMSELPHRIGTDSDWRTIARSWANALAVKSDGSLWGWGNNGSGQLSQSNKSFFTNLPVRIGTDTDWSQISVGASHCLALKNDGSLWAWGQNDRGQVGNGSKSTQSSMAPVNNDHDWKTIATGDFNSFALKQNGTIWGWGLEGKAGGSNDDLIPVQLDPGSNWVSISSADYCMLALKADGTLWLRGQNASQVSSDFVPGSTNAFTRIGQETNWAEVHAGQGYFIARKTDGTWWAGGQNDNGQLGLGSHTYSGSPRPLPCNFEPWAMAVGYGNTLLLTHDGTLWTWGKRIGWTKNIGIKEKLSFALNIAVDFIKGRQVRGRSLSFGSAQTVNDLSPHRLWELTPPIRLALGKNPVSEPNKSDVRISPPANPVPRLDLPPRPTNALSGAKFAASILALERPERETKIYEQVALGNVPDFLRRLVPVHVQSVQNGDTNSATYYVVPDYLAIGSDDDYFLTPLTPATAQKVADLVHCSLPTRKMVDDIYAAATLKLVPSPIPPTGAMITVPIFIQHNSTVAEQRKSQLAAHPLGELVAGHKKDVVISAKLATNSTKVAIYGWHKPDGKPIQPLYIGHADTWADYSHGIRLIQESLTVNGKPSTISAVLADANLAPLLSDEGTFTSIKYPTTPQTIVTPKSASTAASGPLKTVSLADFQPAPFDEQTVSYTIDPEVKVHINAPVKLGADKKLRLIFFTLPNGNSTGQTIGHRLKPGEDWHFDIQHIGAQTRFLRNVLTNENLVVVYLEAYQKSWPTWRKIHAAQPKLIPGIVASVKGIFKSFTSQVTLSGHSGGGSFIFGYINGVDHIPDDIERIAFLDSNYAYDKSLKHDEKLLEWLHASDHHYLSLLAYNDAVALLNGKTFVSAAGGTWGRSHAMLEDLAELQFTSQTNSDLGLETYSALDGRVKFLLKENPDKKIFHTVQVEKNGFIQSILSGTPFEGNSYTYFGDRAYTNWVSWE